MWRTDLMPSLVAHSAGKANAERVGRKLWRTFAERVLNGELLSRSIRCPSQVATSQIEYNEQRRHSS